MRHIAAWLYLAMYLAILWHACMWYSELPICGYKQMYIHERIALAIAI